MTYLIMFASALLAATLVPGSSEVVLTGFIIKQDGVAFVLVAVATLGNLLGSIVNWYCGKALLHLVKKNWFPVTQKQIDRASYWYNEYGLVTLLFSWVPVLGDPLTVVAGSLRVPLPLFIILVGIGKFLRYLFVMYVALQLA